MISASSWENIGALVGTRTPNLLIRSQMLYPLSYERGRLPSLRHSRVCCVQSTAVRISLAGGQLLAKVLLAGLKQLDQHVGSPASAVLNVRANW